MPMVSILSIHNRVTLSQLIEHTHNLHILNSYIMCTHNSQTHTNNSHTLKPYNTHYLHILNITCAHNSQTHANNSHTLKPYNTCTQIYSGSMTNNTDKG